MKAKVDAKDVESLLPKHKQGNDAEEDKEAGKNGKSSHRVMRLLLAFTGLQASYILWGLFQETLMTKEYSRGQFKSSSFCVFSNRLLALVMSLAIVIYKKLTNKYSGKKEPPFYYYAPSSLSNSLSSWAQYESLKYVSFPTQVLSKSCKLIPVMLVSMLLVSLLLVYFRYSTNTTEVVLYSQSY